MLIKQKYKMSVHLPTNPIYFEWTFKQELVDKCKSYYEYVKPIDLNNINLKQIDDEQLINVLHYLKRIYHILGIDREAYFYYQDYPKAREHGCLQDDIIFTIVKLWTLRKDMKVFIRQIIPWIDWERYYKHYQLELQEIENEPFFIDENV